MDSTIAAVLLLDCIGNGAVYALLGMAIVLVFAVTRVILIPQGEFVAYSALTLAMRLKDPVVAFAVNAGAVATPDALVRA